MKSTSLAVFARRLASLDAIPLPRAIQEGTTTTRKIAAATLAVSLGLSAAATAQTSSSKALTVVVPYAAGGSTDVLARIVGRKYSEMFGQSVIIDNRGGGGGAVGAVAVKNAAADGHTLLVANPAIMAVNPILTPNLAYDPTRDFKPVQLIYNIITFLYVPASSPARSMANLVAMARGKPGGLSYASQGVGATGHLGGAMMQALTGAPFVHVPYKGSGPGMVDLAAGRADLFFSIYASAAPFLKAGTVKALAVANANRMKKFPDIPTTAEQGFPSIVLDFWFGLFAPSGTPDSIVAKLNQNFRKIVESPDINQRITDEVLEPMTATPAEIAALIAADKVRYEKAFRELGARAQ